MEHDGGRYHIETSPLIFGANQWTDFYMITASVMKELKTPSNQIETLSAQKRTARYYFNYMVIFVIISNNNITTI